MQSRSISGLTDEGLSTYPEISCLLYPYGDELEDKNAREPQTSMQIVLISD